MQSIALVWARFGPYHMDRCEALGERLEGKCLVHGIEIGSETPIYAWAETGQGDKFAKHTLFPSKSTRELSRFAIFHKLLWTCIRFKARHVFLPGYERLEFFILAIALQVLRRRVYLMVDSKFDDMPRRAWREFLKSFVLVPYSGALAAGRRTESYLRFLGFRKAVVLGHDTVALDELVDLAGCLPAPDGPPLADRTFVLVARFVPKKDIATAIAAYSRYRELAGVGAREFRICGSGPLEAEIRQQIADLDLDGVVLHGFLQRDGIARVVSGGLALVIPSIEEQWGLVVNEALAFCLPVLATDQVGARDLLIRTGVNGYIFEPGNVEGLAHLMYRVGHDEAEWRRLVEGSRQLRAEADTSRFVDGILHLRGSR